MPVRSLSGGRGRLGALRPDRRAVTCRVRHACRAHLSLAAIDDDWPFKRNVEHNPVFSYLYHQHRDALRSSSTVIRDLLESPHRPIQLVALTALAEGGTDATSRVLENLRLLTAFLLNEAARNTKKLALVVLECAARADADGGNADSAGP